MSGGLAARVMGWQRRMAARPGPFAGSGEVPDGPVMVEFLIDGQWTNTTGYVMTRDGSEKVSITRGQSSEGSTPDPGMCRFQLNNRDGRWSPRNPLSPYYGKIGRNTQVRISVPLGNGKNYRFWGEISAWPQKWDLTGNDVWVDVEAAGILRRLKAGIAPTTSVLYRGLTADDLTPAPIAYWPCEDMASATSIASGLSGGTPMTITGTPTLASYDGFAGSDPIPVMGSAKFTGTIPSYTVTGETQVRFLLAVPAAGELNGQVICRLATTGTAAFWELVYGTGGSLALQALDGDEVTLVGGIGAAAFAVDGRVLRVSVELEQDGADVDCRITVLEVGDSGASTVTGTLSANTVGRVTAVTMAHSQGLTDTAMGHVSFQDGITSLGDLLDELDAYDGELAKARIFRLCAEQGVNIVFYAPSTDTVTMGPQRKASMLDLLQECVDADMGVLLEREVAFGLAYRPRTSVYNQAAQLALSYSGHELSEAPDPVDDDQATRNDITVSRADGSSARATLDEGALSVLPPPLGVGRYEQSITLAIQSDLDLPDQAAWRLHVGTVDEARYPQLSINLAHSTFTGSAAMRSNALSLLPGFRVTVGDLPSWLPPDDINQLVLGISETIDHFEHRIVLNCAPYSPWQVATTDDDDYGRADTAGSELATAVGPTDATLSLTTTSGPLWVRDGTLNANPDFETDTSGWSGSGATIARVATPGTYTFPGSWSLEITPDGVAAFPAAVADLVAVAASTSHRMTAWLRTPTARTVDLGVDWYTAGLAYISTTTVSGSLSANNWVHYDATATSPATAAFAQIGALVGGTPSPAEIFYADEMRLLPAADDYTDEFPFDVRLGGEVVTVLGISGASSPQSATVIRSVNGIVKSHPAGTDVRLAHPAIVAL